ncbi:MULTISPECIES: DNA polymerase III subunit theta [Pantoea]|jgi:DNA polymerase-3 subunit theta|uniref:DNA polymerase III subunit theta n=1 Tax=Pantoea brenneri TaxID=472694 RepID=A0A7Y6NJ06_9GAMM|nr:MULTISPECIES: DNA polymerase III subunit theta [Pantoea]MBZ6398060.1 DNA polymerase III subunit theta [Pantoea sp.]MBZ6441146.1 DNA polymerase III subunit theta [Pantoea sp.]MDU4129816.1 DNA polymerase III subunit theta [Pantoea sp.]MDU7867708.1 DNA polymerase III subunit theta [Pantoea sp.]NUY44534.1 DNA polymerase III subunit theta [Pantoea brenneri]
MTAQASRYNLAARSTEERDRINADLAASGVAYKERMNKPVLAHEAEMQLPAELREYFRLRLEHYRKVAKQFPSGTDPVYQKEEGKN